MIKQEIMSTIQTIIDETHVAVLSTVDAEGAPHSRWVTPGCVGDRFGMLYMISESNMAKIDQITNNPKVEMLFQTQSLDKIVNVAGKAIVLTNPMIRSEVLECVGKRLHAFWKVNNQEKELVVLELEIEQVTLYNPVSGTKTTINFTGE